MSKEHAYAYEAGYRDGSINYELEHCPACKNVADLQEALDENARLRKIAREQRECMAYGNECDGCPHRISAGGCDASFWNEYNSILMGEEEDNNG